jgi:hypothetical protein
VLPFPVVKILRACLLLLVAVLLPVRGVLAAAMVCPHAGGGLAAQVAHVAASMHAGGCPEAGPAAMQMPAHPHAHLHMDARVSMDAHGHAHAVFAHDHGPHAQHPAAASHACTLCASCCFTVPLSPTFAPAVASLEAAAASLPPVHAPAPSFFSDGPERPPRSA